MKRRRISHILISLVLALSAQGQHRMSASLANVESDGYYRINITPDLTSHLQTDLRDLRIVDDKGNQVPYAIIDVKKFTETLIRDTPMRIWEQRRESGRSIITLESKPGINISNLSFQLRNASADRVASLSGSDNNNDWYAIIDSFILSPSPETNQPTQVANFNFPPSNYRYLRLTIHDGERKPLNILSASSKFVEGGSRNDSAFVKNPLPGFVQVDSAGKSYVSISSDLPFQISRINFDVSHPPMYRRHVKLFYANLDTAITYGSSIFAGSFYLSSDNEEGYEFPLVRTKNFYIVTENEDNQPLKIRSIDTWQPSRYAIAYLEKGKNYKLLLDDAEAKTPRYDIEAFSSRISGAKAIGIGPIKKHAGQPGNSDPSRSDKRWIWPALVAVIVALGLLSWRLSREMRKER